MLSNTSRALFAVFVKLGLGSAQYILAKMLIDERAQTSDPNSEERKFDRSWFLTFATVFAMAVCSLPVIPGELRKYRSAKRDANGQRENAYSKYLFILSAFPAALDVMALKLSYQDNSVLAATVMVLLKGSRAIFTACLTSFVLGRKQTSQNWAGIVVTTMGVGAIALESVLSNKRGSTAHTNSEVGYALAMTMVAELARAIRFVYEERLIKVNRLTPQALVLFESCAGAVIATAAWLIACLGFGHESIADTFAMMSNNTTIPILLTLVIIFSGVCNVAAAFITKYLSSVHNALVSELRVVLVFVPQVIRYKLHEKAHPSATKHPGEKLDWFSLIKIAGFGLLLVGAAVYNGNIRIPFLNAPGASKPVEEEQEPQAPIPFV